MRHLRKLLRLFVACKLESNIDLMVTDSSMKINSIIREVALRTEAASSRRLDLK